MKHPIRIAIASAALFFGLAVSGASPAEAQVSFQGSFPLPHGHISIAVGDPAFRVGAYVPWGYSVVSRVGYGYGFDYRDRFIPVRRVGPRWIVCDRPYAVAHVHAYRPVGGYYGRPYGRERGEHHQRHGHARH